MRSIVPSNQKAAGRVKPVVGVVLQGHVAADAAVGEGHVAALGEQRRDLGLDLAADGRLALQKHVQVDPADQAQAAPEPASQRPVVHRAGLRLAGPEPVEAGVQHGRQERPGVGICHEDDGFDAAAPQGVEDRAVAAQHEPPVGRRREQRAVAAPDGLGERGEVHVHVAQDALGQAGAELPVEVHDLPDQGGAVVEEVHHLQEAGPVADPHRQEEPAVDGQLQHVSARAPGLDAAAPVVGKPRGVPRVEPPPQALQPAA